MSSTEERGAVEVVTTKTVTINGTDGKPTLVLEVDGDNNDAEVKVIVPRREKRAPIAKANLVAAVSKL